jgi:hypothetical protein
MPFSECVQSKKMTESENKNATLHTHAEWRNENTDKFNNSDRSR